ncbi:hypothetical protein X759_28980 [Mesorhizobium sp. LSHC420B00]|nr:hypothetical protein [Mesorhizobium sp. LSHC420B00]ESX65448.1 hypothetical protein X759_28980 [Mesorhizobium sp. LSHC420B00]
MRKEQYRIAVVGYSSHCSRQIVDALVHAARKLLGPLVAKTREPERWAILRPNKRGGVLEDRNAIVDEGCADAVDIVPPVVVAENGVAAEWRGKFRK